MNEQQGLTFFQIATVVAAMLVMIAGAAWLDRRAQKSGSFVQRILRKLFPPKETLEGYEQPALVDVIFRKTLAYEPQGEWPEMRGASSVLDFGGGCGLHYKQARSPSVRWAVVETPAMVERAKELATDRLQFFTSVSEAANWLGPVDVMHSNGALQYSSDPESILKQLCSIGAKRMLWYRVLIGEGQEVQESLLGDNGPGSIQIREKTVRYARTKIPESNFIAAHAGYQIDERGPDWFHLTKPAAVFGRCRSAARWRGPRRRRH